MKKLAMQIWQEQHRIITTLTFGHLAPDAHSTYQGFIIFAYTTFGDTVIVEFDFKGLEASPWFNSDILEFITDYTDHLPQEKSYGLFRFDGKYHSYPGEEFNFEGNLIEISCKLKTTATQQQILTTPN